MATLLPPSRDVRFGSQADITAPVETIRKVPLADISRFLARAWHIANKKARELAHKDEVNADLLAFMEA